MSAKILFFDIETSPLEVFVWGLGEQYVGLEQICKDWSVLAWAAKWQHCSSLIYRDNRNRSNPRDDKKILKDLWELLDEADIVVTQNGKKFDVKKVNARFIKHEMQPPSAFRQIDTLQIKRKIFGFTSNKLAYTSQELCPDTKKSDHKKFPGLELWKECLIGNPQAWREMERYNKQDVLALEKLYNKLIPWDSSTNFSLYRTDDVKVCSCGSTNLHRRGYYYTSAGKYQKYRCVQCGAETYSGKNLAAKLVAQKGVSR